MTTKIPNPKRVPSGVELSTSGSSGDIEFLRGFIKILLDLNRSP